MEKTKTFFLFQSYKGLASLTKHIEKKVGFLRVDAAEPLLTTIRQKKQWTIFHLVLQPPLSFWRVISMKLSSAEEIKNAIVNIDLFTGKTITTTY